MHKELEKYIYDKYKVSPEAPFRDGPDTLAFKDPYTGKWFALLFPVEAKRLGLLKAGKIFIVNLKADPDFVAFIGGTEGIMPAYHMNKRRWISVCLDGSVGINEVESLLDASYELVANTPTRRIYEAVKRIPKGKVATYKTVAAMAGEAKMARAVGNALHRNPDPDTIPCFRVVNSKGELSGNFAFGGPGGQARLLEEDGIEVVDGKVDLLKYGYTFMEE